MLDRHRHRRHSLSISKSGQWYFEISLLTMSMAAVIISCTVKAETNIVLGGVGSGGVEVASSRGGEHDDLFKAVRQREWWLVADGDDEVLVMK
ncbi:hypothetical protein Tco_0934015 [Tanacetum coccineum]